MGPLAICMCKYSYIFVQQCIIFSLSLSAVLVHHISENTIFFLKKKAENKNNLVWNTFNLIKTELRREQSFFRRITICYWHWVFWRGRGGAFQGGGWERGSHGNRHLCHQWLLRGPLGGCQGSLGDKAESSPSLPAYCFLFSIFYLFFS